VEIVSDADDVRIVATERVIYTVNGVDASFTEMMALPASQLDTTYWLPWYNNLNIDTQLRIANASNTDAVVHINIGGTPVPGSPFTISQDTGLPLSFAGIDNGPVEIHSNVNIVASERVIYKVNGTPVSFSEMVALPNKLLDTIYWLPWYNNKNLDTQLRVANVSSTDATVSISIGATPVPGSPFTIVAGTSLRESFAGIDQGPVKIESNVDVVVAERVIYEAAGGVDTSFSEMMALPNKLLDTIYWLPWYNNKNLDTQLRFGVP
jgi:hypothetical protein